MSVQSAEINTALALAEGAPAHIHSLPPPIVKVGRYDVLGRVAVGGMAEIFLAREAIATGAQRHAAIKVLKRQHSEVADEKYFEELFLREGRTASQLIHPNICHVYEFGKAGPDYFIAMEWIDGKALRDIWVALGERGESIASSIATGIAAQIASALEYAHTARDARRRALQVVHLDVSPQNIMVRYDGVVKLVDFGLAQVADVQGDSRSDIVKGKTGYFAPEQIRGEKLDGRVDVFALGVCLFEMLTGTRLYARESLASSVRAILEEPPPSVRKRRPEIAEELDAIVRKALAKDPSERFQSAGQLQAALERYLADKREVVSNRALTKFMAELFPGAEREAPTLDTSPEVVARLMEAARASHTPPGAEASRNPRAPTARWLVLGALVVLAALAAFVLGPWRGAHRPVAERVERAPAPLTTLPDKPAQDRSDEPSNANDRAAGASEPEPKSTQAPVRRSPGFVDDPGF